MLRPIAFASTTITSLLTCLQAQEPPPAGEPAPREWVGGLPYWEWTHATGDWGGYRTQLQQAGIEVAGGFTADFASAWSGNTRRRLSAPTLLDVNVAFDLETLVGLRRTIAYVDAYQIEGRDPSDDIGDFQGLSNIQATDRKEIAEVWLETWLGDQFRVKVGKVDFNSEFAFHEIGGDFVNSTGALPPTIVGYPTYPDPAMSVNVFYKPDEHNYVGIAIYDGATADGFATGPRGPSTFFSSRDSNSYFYALELGHSWTGGETWGSGRAVLGGFHHTATFARFDGGTKHGTQGLWASIEQNVWRESPTANDGQGIGVFATLGFADQHVSACGSSIAVGVEWIGSLPGRDHDALDFGVFHCDLSNDPGAATAANETVLELLYKIQVTPAMSLKPEVQYIMNPGGQDGVDDVLVGLLRLEILF